MCIRDRVQIVLYHLRDGFIIRQVSDDTGHICIPGKLAGFLAAVAGYDFIAAILTGTDNSGLGNSLVLDAGYHSPHFFIVPDFKGMVFEGGEFVQLDIDDLLLVPAWSILRLIGFLWKAVYLPPEKQRTEMESFYRTHAYLVELSLIHISFCGGQAKEAGQ